MIMMDGGIKIPSVPPAVITPAARRVSYPARSIGWKATTPISTTTAPTSPVAMPQKAHTTRLVTASDAGTPRSESCTE